MGIEGETAWKQLVERYADGRKPCNCGQAYYTRCVGADARSKIPICGSSRRHPPHDYCAYGCSHTLGRAHQEIALRVVEEMKLLDEMLAFDPELGI